jgi:hypothetical protein
MCSRTEEDNISKNIKLSSPMSTKWKGTQEQMNVYTYILTHTAWI